MYLHIYVHWSIGFQCSYLIYSHKLSYNMWDWFVLIIDYNCRNVIQVSYFSFTSIEKKTIFLKCLNHSTSIYFTFKATMSTISQVYKFSCTKYKIKDKYNICLLYANNKVDFFYISWHGTMFSFFVDGILKLKSRVTTNLNISSFLT